MAFHPLTVTELRHDTRDAVVLTLEPRAEDRAVFDFKPGQYLTFRRSFEGTELRRCYSICAGKDEGLLRVGVKRVEGGAFSTFAKEQLKPGDILEAMPPAGRFRLQPASDQSRHFLGFAGGSGITPLLSIIKSVLSSDPASRFTLIYANRQISQIMFREELEDLKNSYLERFSIVHVLESDSQDIDLFTGRIDTGKLDQLFRHWVDLSAIDSAYICGPEPMMLTIADGLNRQGLKEDRIKFELFSSDQTGRVRRRAAAEKGKAADKTCAVSLTLDGATRSFSMPRDGTAVLEAALDNAIDAPFSCRAGVCSTCRAKVLEGEFEMEVSHALEDYEIRAGYVLSCQCVPLGETLVLSYDN